MAVLMTIIVRSVTRPAVTSTRARDHGVPIVPVAPVVPVPDPY